MRANAAIAYHPEDASSVPQAALILKLRGLGILNHAVLNAIETVPRALFAPREFRLHASTDCTIPIDCGQVMEAPSLVARIAVALEVGDRHSVLEIGTGSGYFTAVLARLARRVTTMERFWTLARQADRHWTSLGLRNVSLVAADGSLGWKRQAPFDRILVAAAFAAPPSRLLAQLGEGGILIAPVGAGVGRQRLTLFQRNGDEFEARDLGPVEFLPLVPCMALAL